MAAQEGCEIQLQCNDIISSYNDIHNERLKFQEFSLQSINNEVIGYLADYCSLLLKCTNDNQSMDIIGPEGVRLPVEINLFVKKRPHITSKDDERLKIFRKESDLYRHILPKLRNYSLNIWSPHAYLCCDNVLVLEDLRYSGFTQCLGQRKANPPEMFNILKTLASMHCSSLIYEQRYQCCLAEAFPYCLEEITVDMKIPWFSTGLKTILEIVKHYIPSYGNNVHMMDELEQGLYSVCDMVQSSTKYRNVLCHRDTWGGNILLDAKNSKVILVDFQTCRYCPPAIDVILTLHMNSCKDDLRVNRDLYLAFYYAELFKCLQHYQTKAVVPCITEQEFYESYNALELFGFVYRAVAATILNVPKEIVTDNYKNVERFTKLKKYMKENEQFRQVMLECVQDIIDYVTVKKNLTIKHILPKQYYP